ncbi:MAG: oligo,6-glucosidase [Clostridiales bacterium]|jgi:oligo-1,6-glucosidase|nr:oligo,6-glucosidase [Clostridiales bacterium]
MKKTWWKESVIYQIYPRSFKDSNGDGIGDIPGIIEKLDYLKNLGIDIIWLSPVYKSPNDDNGYDISDYQDIMDEFGTLKDFDELLKEAHSRGIKIVMDLVVNHSSDEHKWFVESKKSIDNKYRDYYIWRPAKDGKEPNNWGSCFSGSAWKYDETTNMYFLHLFSKKQPDLNWNNPELREEVYNMMTWWLDKGIDGFRMDVINFIGKDQAFPDGTVYPGALNGDFSTSCMNKPVSHEYLKEMNDKVLSKYDIVTVGEAPGAQIEDAKKYAGENTKELNMVFQFEHMDVGNGSEGKWNSLPFKLVELKKILAKWQTGLQDEAWNSLYWNNHDQPRVVSRFGNDKEYWNISAKMLATCLHMLQGTPFIYQGEELGMTNVSFESIDDYKDIEIINAYDELVNQRGFSHEFMMNGIYGRGRDNARTPIQWDDSENAGFTTGSPWIKVNPNYRTINAASQINDPNSIFNYYKLLLRLRKENEIMVYGKFDLLLADHEQIFAYTRTLEEKLLVVCNFSADAVDFKADQTINYSTHKLLLSNYEQMERQDITNFVLRPYETAVYVLN